VDDQGARKDNAEDIERNTLDYYTSTSTSDQPTQFDAVEQAIEPKITVEMNAILTKGFQPDEVWHAIQLMHPMKSPGSDGMPPIFYQKFWNIVGQNTTECVLNILKFGIMPTDINATHICLIPKKNNPQKITDYHPISLSNVLSHIVSKSWLTDLKRCCPKLSVPPKVLSSLTG